MTTDEVQVEKLGAQAMVLTPGKRAALGSFLVLVGVALFFDERTTFVPPLPYVVIACGLLVLGSAVTASRKRQRLEAEFTDVLQRWDQLASGAREAQSAGRSVVRYLQEQGISRYEVRRFVLAHFRGDERPTADMPRRTSGVMSGEEVAGTLRDGSRGRLPGSMSGAPPGPRWLPKP